MKYIDKNLPYKEVKMVITESKIIYVNSSNERVLLTRKNKKGTKKPKEPKIRIKEKVFPEVCEVGMKSFDEALKDYIKKININK